MLHWAPIRRPLAASPGWSVVLYGRRLLKASSLTLSTALSACFSTTMIVFWRFNSCFVNYCPRLLPLAMILCGFSYSRCWSSYSGCHWGGLDTSCASTLRRSFLHLRWPCSVSFWLAAQTWQLREFLGWQRCGDWGCRPWESSSFLPESPSKGASVCSAWSWWS